MKCADCTSCSPAKCEQCATEILVAAGCKPNGRQASRRPDRRRVSRRQEEFETGLEIARANLRVELEASEPPPEKPKFFPEIGEEGESSFLPADLAFETATA